MDLCDTSTDSHLQRTWSESKRQEVSVFLNDEPVVRQQQPQEEKEEKKEEESSSLAFPPARKRSASLNAYFLSPPLVRPCRTPPPSPWHRTADPPLPPRGDFIADLPDTHIPAFEPPREPPSSPSRLSPVLVRSPTLAKRAFRDGLGVSSVDADASKAMRRAASHRCLGVEDENAIGAPLRRRTASTSKINSMGKTI